MKLGLHLRLKQTLAPQLIQSLKMLQMPTLKLEQTLRNELVANPMLEEVEQSEVELTDTEMDTADRRELEISQTTEKDPRLQEIDWDTYLNENHDFVYRGQSEERSGDFIEQTSAAQITLYDHLIEQLHLLKTSDEDRDIGEYIIGNLDHRGFLVTPVADMAAELEVTPERIEATLVILRRFDPVGVCSRDLRESLMAQLEEKGLDESLAYRIVERYLYELDRKSAPQLAKLMGESVEETQHALDVIKSLAPDPTQGRFDAGAMPVTPDLIVERVGDDFVVYHNDRNLPRMRINGDYRSLLKRSGGSSDDTRQYVREKLEQARWLLNAINQRRETMLKVMNAIVGEQREFFEKGPAFLRPLIMEDIARIVDMNVATISRVANSKYALTPHGVYEIKHFFNTGIPREDGEKVSKRSVKQRLGEILAAEDPSHPLSDQEIFQKLKDEGVQLARRTVTKYREELGVSPARFRRRT